MVNIVNSLTGSSIDIQALAKSLTDASRAPQQTILDERKTIAESKISSIGRIYASANDLKLALSAFGSPRQLGLTPSSSDTTKASFTYNAYATQASLDLTVEVQKLATANTVSLMPLAKGAKPGGTGTGATLNIYSGDKPTDPAAAKTLIKAFNLDDYPTLNDLADAVRATAGFDATVLNAADGTQRLTITRGTGASKHFYVETVLQDGSAASDGLMVNSVAAQSAGTDAQIVADGQTYTSGSNSFTSLISGVSINVASTGTVRLFSNRNTDQQVAALREMVANYNQLLETVNTEITYDKDVQKRGGLANDFVARSFLFQMRRLTTDPIVNTAGNVTLAELGVRTEQNGTLTIDETRLNKVVSDQPELLQNVMASSGAKQGALEKMLTLAETVLGVNGPFVRIYNQTQNSDLPAIEEAIEKLNDQMDALQRRYLQQFTSMQDVLSSTKKSQESLTQAMAAWTAGLKNS
jgi:flagellar hook-associated protein 2